MYFIKQTIIRVSTQTGMKHLNRVVLIIYVTMAMPALVNTCTIRAQRTEGMQNFDEQCCRFPEHFPQVSNTIGIVTPHNAQAA